MAAQQGLSRGNILNSDDHDLMIREHCIFRVFFPPCPLSVFSKTSVLLQRFQLQVLATWGWNSQADIAIDNITFGLDCSTDGEPQMLQNPLKNLGSVISIPQIQDTHALFSPQSTHGSFVLAFTAQCHFISDRLKIASRGNFTVCQSLLVLFFFSNLGYPVSHS